MRSASEPLLRRLGAEDVVEGLEGDFDFVLDGVGGATFGLAIEHVAPMVSWSTSGRSQMTRRSPSERTRFERAFGARIYTLNLFDELASRPSPTSDLTRLCGLIVDGRLDGQVQLEDSWRRTVPAIEALLHRRIGGKAVLHID